MPKYSGDVIARAPRLHPSAWEKEQKMNWEAFAALGEVSGALAVVASLVFVGYQLRQGQSIERAKAQRDLLEQGREWMAIPGREEQNFEAIRSCLRETMMAPTISTRPGSTAGRGACS